MKITIISIIFTAILANPVMAMTPGYHYLYSDGTYCEVWREGMPKQKEIGTYCGGVFETYERLYQLETIVEDQRIQIDDLQRRMATVEADRGHVAVAGGQTTVIMYGSMTPEMTELFSAFEARVAKLEQKMVAIERLVGAIQGAITSIKKRIGIK